MLPTSNYLTKIIRSGEKIERKKKKTLYKILPLKHLRVLLALALSFRKQVSNAPRVRSRLERVPTNLSK